MTTFLTRQITTDEMKKIRIDLELEDNFTELQMTQMTTTEMLNLFDVAATGDRQEWTGTYRSLLERRSRATWTRREIILRLAWASIHSA